MELDYPRTGRGSPARGAHDGIRVDAAEPPAGVSLTRSDYVPPPGDRVGGQGERVFGLEVAAPGRYELDFHLGRSSSREAAERRTVTLIAER